ncbi:alternative oxidase AOX1 precursor [Zea mays]|uniref:Ubiquinol oxidase n=1 Tax=Zea mays TaxID=4577 RepID=Q8GT27_MAIZE|nr:alternative oxidase AOX1 precursor [Zea mays]AAL27795.1 alternative oxidase AOX1 precursor [Zea mays]ACF79381.1 unknown [Zea mays]ACF86059.1 unknown [Zea mays]ACN31252.1 unknown [Zea mays]ACR36770.1 unknown [Zea mays]|eukprot:NP_001105179.1 alternative oxidase AOX1 precursor [Zea mays]
MSTRAAGSALLRHLGPRVFGPVFSPAVAPPRPLLALAGGGERGGALVWVRVRLLSTSAAEAKEEVAASKGNSGSTAAAKAEAVEAAKEGDGKRDKVVSSYWGVAPSKLMNKDGAEWRWSCFRPWEAYKPDTTIDLNRHHEPKVLLDKIAYWTVKLLRVPTDIFFQRRYGCRAMMLETVAAVPGMVGGMLLHLRSLRRFEHSGGWIRALLEEAENERMHLMTFMEVAKPKWYERALVLAVQGVFFNAYFLGYLISPKFAHRVVGYLEEEAIHSYTEYLKDLEAGKIENVPAPAIAIDYWQLPADATLKDVVVVVRSDEAHHRDVNHFASDIHFQGMQLKETPAPIEYH